MRYISKQKEILPPIESIHDCIDAEDYLIKETKRQIVIGMIEKLPFKIKKTPTPIGYEFEIELDVIIKDTQEEIDKLLKQIETTL
jgi:hypothetical protein